MKEHTTTRRGAASSSALPVAPARPSSEGSSSSTERIRVRALPIAGTETASSRIRCFRLLEHLPAEQFDVDLLTRVIEEGDVEFDVLYLQKAAHEHVLELAREAIAMGIKVVYDIDDPFGLYGGMHEEEMCRLATAVTVDTEARAEVVRAVTDRPVHVVPDCLDYVGDALVRAPLRDRLGEVVTFGNVESLAATRNFLARVPEGIGRTYIGRPAGQIPDCRYIEWKLETFLEDLARFDVALLVHDSSSSGVLKSNNRLLVALSIGLPTIVSDTPAYAETVRALGHPELICASPTDVPRALRSIEDVGRRLEIAEAGVRLSWENYSPAVVAALFGELLRSL